MIFAYLAWLSPLVFIPGVFDAFSGPKRIYVLLLGIAASVCATRDFKAFPLLYPIALYVLVAVIPGVWVSDPYLFIERLGIDFAGISLFWVLASKQRDEKEVETLCLFALIIVAACYLVRHFAPPVESLFYPMGNPKYFALMAAQALPLGIGFPPLLFFFSTAVLVVFISESKAALLATGVTVFLSLISPWKLGLMKAGAVLALLIPLAVLFSPLRLTGDKYDPRRATWANSKVMAVDAMKYVAGFGSGQFQVWYPAYANRAMRETEILLTLESRKVYPDGLGIGHPHNEALNQIIETGIGYLILLFILARIFFHVQVNNSLQIALAGSLISTLVLSAFWFPLSHPSMAITFWSTAGLLWSVSEKR